MKICARDIARRAFRPRAARLIAVATVVLLGAAMPRAGRADGSGASSDSVYLIGEFVDPVCIFQHGMQGALQKQCAHVRGRVEQGMFFLDIRHRELYAVIGQTHWEDPRAGFFEALGDTFAVRGKVWRRSGSSAIAINAMWPYRQQPEPAFTWWPWHWAWSVVGGCALIAGLYLLALVRRARRLGPVAGRTEAWRIGAFMAALAIVILALNGPIHDLSDLYLFNTHMIQHLMLSELFPPLLLLGLPAWLLRGMLAPRPIGIVWRALSRVPVGAALYTVVFSIWHVPALYNLMMRDHDFHIVMHLMVMVTAVLTWWPVIGRGAIGTPLSPPVQMLYLFLLGTPMMAVAALITFPNHALYDWYALAPRFMGMSAVDDQRLGGLLMWVPGGLYYWGAMSVVYFRWASRQSRPDDDLVTAT